MDGYGGGDAWRKRRAVLDLLGLLALLVLLAPDAQARIHSLTGDARFQVGNGLPVPVGATPAPNGRVAAIPGATIRQHGVHVPGVSPAKIVLDPAQLSVAPVPLVVPVFTGNPVVFQVQTAIGIQFPKSKVSLMAGGRTGAPTVTFCPGDIVTNMGNPGCPGGAGAAGLLRYVSTSSQFGGAASSLLSGSANQAIRAGASPPCTGAACIVVFASVTPPSMPGPGNAFGFATTASKPPTFPGAFTVSATAFGLITNVGLVVGGGAAHASTQFGGPWTTGRVTVSEPAAIPPQIFIFSGADGRAAGSGAGSISLVSGGLTVSNLNGRNAARGWLNLTVGPVVSHVPAMPVAALAAALFVLTVSGAWRLVSRQRRS